MNIYSIFKYKSIFYIICLISISFFFNQYYAYIGVLPVDSFSTFNAGYNILNDHLPFRDYWTIKGPFIDLIQAIFFKYFNVSWFSYAAHASSLNTVFALSTFYTLRTFNLKNNYCFFYSVLGSILMYPTYGIPFTDHHASILSMMSIYSLCLAIKTNKSIYLFILPILLFLAFFSKQAPTGYFGLFIFIILAIYLIKNFKINKIICIFLGSFLIISLFFFIILINKISIHSIILQYFLFPLSLGDSRLEWLFPIEFKRFVLRHKLIYLSLSLPIFIFFQNILKKRNNILADENLIIILLFGTLLIFISHQLMTINGLYIFFLIPVFSGFSHTFVNQYIKKKKFIYFFLILSFVSTIYYHHKYINKRDTYLLRNVNFSNSINGSEIDVKLKGIKWITHHYPDNPKKEIKNIIEAINIIKIDGAKKMIVTDYQFIGPILSIKDNTAVRLWWRHHMYPEQEEKYFIEWKSFLLDKIINKKVKKIYTIHPLEGEKNILMNILSEECYSKKILSDILDVMTLKSCKDINTFLNKDS